MKPNRIPTIAIAVIALALPIAALADVTGTPTLAANTALSLDTGATSSSGGDILWSGTSIAPQGNATAYNIGPGGAAAYSAYTQAILSALGSFYSKSAISAGSLAVGDVFAVKTNGGNYAKVLVTAIGTSIGLQFDTFGAASTSSGPTITAVWDAASNTSGVAEGSVFIVKGSKLCPVQANTITLFTVPRPTSSADGVKITFTPTAGGGGTDSLLIYEYNPSGVCQLAAILPSTVAPGTYNVTVTNGTVSAPFQSTVLQRKFALITQDSTGTGLAAVQNVVSAAQYDVNSFTTGAGKGTTISPAKPGQYLIAYGTGMGPLVGGDNSSSPVYDFSSNGVAVQAIVGGVSVPVLFAGRAGYAGEDQINFQLPANVPTGCTVSLQISVNGQLSDSTFIAIAPNASAGACIEPGFTAAQLQQYDNGASQTLGYFGLTQFTMSVPSVGTAKVDGATGGFTRYTGYQLAGLAHAQAQVTSSGSCIVAHVQSSTQVGLTPTPAGGLDAGTVTLNGPSSSGIANQPFTQDPNSLQYSLNLGTEGVAIPGALNAALVAGTYTVAGAGGADVGKFSTSVTLGAPLALAGGGLPGTVNRSAGLTLNWSGGNPSDLVEIIGSSGTTSGTGTSAVTDSWTFICTTNAGAGTFTVPSSILLQLPAISASSTTGSGLLEFASAVSPATFSAPLTAGGSVTNSTFAALLGFGSIVSYQ